MLYQRFSGAAGRLLFGSILTCSITGAVATPAAAQARLAVDPALSLAWWQINPHLGHLWATTCPGDPTWRAGEGVSIAQAKSMATSLQKRRGAAAITDTIVPLYPRRRARPVCAPGVTGEVTAADTVNWRGVKGTLSIQTDALKTGLDMRDDYAANAILQKAKYPQIRFRIDSLTNVQRGDTLRANAVGVLELHGVQRPLSIPITAWPEAGGLRVTGRQDIQAREMTEVYHMSKWAIGLGVGTAIWKTLHVGVDVVLKPATGSQQP
jgi:hypothetical protein